MCGIVGLIGPQEPEWLTRMHACLVHRGPDDRGEYRDPGAAVSLGMRRLSILDLASGQQPMGTDDGERWVVHNGEIFNAPQLRASLEQRGCRFRTRNSDTEVLLHLYATRGEAMLEELNGMFAFLLYDRRRRVVFGARDRLGIKPLYYLQRPGFLALASELKALLQLPGVSREVSLASLFHYLSLRYVPGPDAIFAGVRRLPPGHCFTYALDTGGLAVRPYWDLRFEPEEGVSEAEWASRIRDGLRGAVRRWTLSDVPIACSLSGGVDSPAIVGLLGEAGCTDLRTYSVGFCGAGEEAWDERPLARQVAERWGTRHHEIVVEPDRLLDDLVEMVWHLDEPYGGGLPSWYVFKWMAGDVKVGLTGTGGDELFGNYGRYRSFERSRSARLAAWSRRALGARGGGLGGLLAPAARLAGLVPARLLGATRQQRLRDLPALLEDPLRWHYFDVAYYLRDAEKREAVLADDTTAIADTSSLLRELYARSGATSPRDGIAYVDVKTQLADEFLLMTDRFSMAHSLEARVPFLDHAFVELVARIPAAQRTRLEDPKYLLKRAIGDLLPPDLLRAGKRGFELPTALWLRGTLRPLVERLLGPDHLRQQGIFRPAVYPRYVLPHLEARADRSPQVWSLLMFQLWHRVFVEEQATARPTVTWRDLC